MIQIVLDGGGVICMKIGSFESKCRYLHVWCNQAVQRGHLRTITFIDWGYVQFEYIPALSRRLPTTRRTIKCRKIPPWANSTYLKLYLFRNIVITTPDGGSQHASNIIISWTTTATATTIRNGLYDGGGGSIFLVFDGRTAAAAPACGRVTARRVRSYYADGCGLHRDAAAVDEPASRQSQYRCARDRTHPNARGGPAVIGFARALHTDDGRAPFVAGLCYCRFAFF